MTALIAPSPSSVSPAERAALARQVEELAALDLHGLRARWRQRLRGVPPPQLGRSLLMRLLAYRIQARALGDLPPETARYLERVERERRRRQASGQPRKPKAPPPVPPVAVAQRFAPGTLLVREIAGTMHTVTVVEGGYAFAGQVHASLSAVAFAMTGTRWNGPRFFGLRERAGLVERSGPGGAGAGPSGTGDAR